MDTKVCGLESYLVRAEDFAGILVDETAFSHNAALSLEALLLCAFGVNC